MEAIRFLRICVKNWEKFNPRKATKHGTWFRCENDILDNPDFAEFTDAEFRAMIYIFGRCSATNSGETKLSFSHAALRRIEEKVLIRTIEKAIEAGILDSDATARERAGTDRNPQEPVGTDENPQERVGSLRNETKRNETEREPAAPSPVVNLSREEVLANAPPGYAKMEVVRSITYAEDFREIQANLEAFSPQVWMTFKRRVPDILALFGTAQAFFDWANRLGKSEKFKAKSTAQQQDFFTACLVNELKFRRG